MLKQPRRADRLFHLSTLEGGRAKNRTQHSLDPSRFARKSVENLWRICLISCLRFNLICVNQPRNFFHTAGRHFCALSRLGSFSSQESSAWYPPLERQRKRFFAPEQMKFVEKLKSHESSLFILEEERQQDSSSCSLSRKPDRRQKIYLNEIMKTLIVSDGDEWAEKKAKSRRVFLLCARAFPSKVLFKY